jgi:hypothetical protein
VRGSLDLRQTCEVRPADEGQDPEALARWAVADQLSERGSVVVADLGPREIVRRDPAERAGKTRFLFVSFVGFVG